MRYDKQEINHLNPISTYLSHFGWIGPRTCLSINAWPPPSRPPERYFLPYRFSSRSFSSSMLEVSVAWQNEVKHMTIEDEVITVAHFKKIWKELHRNSLEVQMKMAAIHTSFAKRELTREAQVVGAGGGNTCWRCEVARICMVWKRLQFKGRMQTTRMHQWRDSNAKKISESKIMMNCEIHFQNPIASGKRTLTNRATNEGLNWDDNEVL